MIGAGVCRPGHRRCRAQWSSNFQCEGRRLLRQCHQGLNQEIFIHSKYILLAKAVNAKNAKNSTLHRLYNVTAYGWVL